MTIKGYSTQDKDIRLQSQFTTVEPVRENQNALSVNSHEYVFEVANTAVDATSSLTTAVLASASAKTGDVIRFTSGALSGQEVKVWSVSGSTVTLAESLLSAPSIGDTVQILRHKYPKVTSTGEVQVSGTFSSSASGTVISSNSTTTPLGISGTFVGAFVSILDSASLQVAINSDQNSNTNGFKVEFSNDGINVHHTHTYSFIGGTNGIGYLFQPEFRYFRVNFTNGAVAQTTFNLVSILRPVSLLPSQYRISTAITNETQAIMTKSVITGETTAGGGSFVNVKVNPSGAIQVDGNMNQYTVTETVFNNCASTTINGSAGAFVELIASTASASKRIQILDTTGAFIGIYTGGSGSESLKVIAGPGSDQTIDLTIAASTRVSVRRLDSASNITSGIFALNLIG